MNVFDIIPSDFFNYLGGNSNNRVYADCLELIHNQYDKEISKIREIELKKEIAKYQTLVDSLLSDYENDIITREELEKYNINFQSQYRIRDFNISAPFDFALFDNNDKLLGLLEFDGEQHFYSIDYFGGEESFNLQQERDERKNKWCKENNIRLVRIPYTDYDKITIEYLISYFPEISCSEIEN